MPEPHRAPDPQPPASRVQRASFASANTEEVTSFIRQTYAESSTRFAPVTGGARFTALLHDVPSLGSDRVRTSIDYDGTSEEGFDDLVAFVVHAGTVGVASRGDEVVTGSGGAACYPLGVPVAFRMRHFDVTTVRLPVERLRQAAEEEVGRPVEVRLRGTAPVSPAMLRYWRSLTSLVAGALTDPDSPLGQPLLAAEMARTVAHAALHVFPVVTTADRLPRDPTTPAPAAVRRAVAHMEAHAGEPLPLAEIAAAAGTSVRTLQVGFRTHLDTTPLGHLRRVRLERAREELRAAPPEGDGGRTTVAGVAARWGFSNAGRFAAAYRDAFGEPPGATLRR